mmetsp:Transcript_51428/g.143780  ORF Transcript_51428/g.143780 Transcript_51428/m.143780 type:complete len:252 (+) Transcript_51428:2966-3721(+)
MAMRWRSMLVMGMPEQHLQQRRAPARGERRRRAKEARQDHDTNHRSRGIRRKRGGSMDHRHLRQESVVVVLGAQGAALQAHLGERLRAVTSPPARFLLSASMPVTSLPVQIQPIWTKSRWPAESAPCHGHRGLSMRFASPTHTSSSYYMIRELGDKHRIASNKRCEFQCLSRRCRRNPATMTAFRHTMVQRALETTSCLCARAVPRRGASTATARQTCMRLSCKPSSLVFRRQRPRPGGRPRGAPMVTAVS